MLLERVTDFCKKKSLRDYGEVRRAGIEFSHRGGISYSQTVAYHELLRMQSSAGTLYLPKRDIKSEVLHHDLMSSHEHNQRAGLQLADIVASAFYQAVETNGPGQWDPRFARLLKPRMAMENDSWVDYGVALQPTPPWRDHLNEKQKEIFEFYEYRF